MDVSQLIFPGDPRHPCDICGGRVHGAHPEHHPCRPVPLNEAYPVKPIVLPE